MKNPTDQNFHVQSSTATPHTAVPIYEEVIVCEEEKDTWNRVARSVCAILLPPFGVFLATGCDKHFAINVLLTILGKRVLSEMDIDRVNLYINSEREMLRKNQKLHILPVTVISGYLGSGKTSLLCHILKNRLNLKIACAVSDFAEINVDALYLKDTFTQQPDDTRFGLKDVCVCEFPAQNGTDAFKEIVYSLSQYESTRSTIQGEYDFLIVETSGTTDPCTLISVIQEKFGKMTKARLDSVITVMDTDVLLQKKGNVSKVLLQQLQCADIVLLNKMDLIEEIEEVRRFANDFVRMHAPHARVYETKYCEISLPLIFDITPPINTQHLSHEYIPQYWTVNSNFGGTERRRIHAESVPATDFQSVSYEQSEPISLHLLQTCVKTHLTKNTLRMKGSFYFADDTENRYVLQISGHHRIHVHNKGPWRSTPKTSFILIGQNTPTPWVQSDFERAMKKHFQSPNTRPLKPCVNRLSDDPRFQILQISETIIHFRLTCPILGLDEKFLRHRHAIDLNALNLKFVCELNAMGKGLVLLYKEDRVEDHSIDLASDRCRVTILASIKAGASIMDIYYDDVCQKAGMFAESMKKEITKCQCGF